MSDEDTEEGLSEMDFTECLAFLEFESIDGNLKMGELLTLRVMIFS